MPKASQLHSRGLSEATPPVAIGKSATPKVVAAIVSGYDQNAGPPSFQDGHICSFTGGIASLDPRLLSWDAFGIRMNVDTT